MQNDKGGLSAFADYSKCLCKIFLASRRAANTGKLDVVKPSRSKKMNS